MCFTVLNLELTKLWPHLNDARLTFVPLLLVLLDKSRDTKRTQKSFGLLRFESYNILDDFRNILLININIFVAFVYHSC